MLNEVHCKCYAHLDQQTRDMHGGNGQIVEVVQSSFSIFQCHDEVQKM